MKIVIDADERSCGEIEIHFPVEYLSLSPDDLCEHVLKPAIKFAVQQPETQKKLERLKEKQA